MKPGFFQNEDLADLGFESQLLFCGLWTLADREGKLENRPRRIKVSVFPYQDVNIDDLLTGLAVAGFIQLYKVNDINYIKVLNFLKHQNPHKNEAPSTLPEPPGSSNYASGSGHYASARVIDGSAPADSLLLIPDSLSSDSLTPLQSPQGDASAEKFSAKEREKFFDEEFWPNVWRKIGTGAARTAFAKKAKTRQQAERIRDAAIAQSPGIQEAARANGRSELHPATWLNQSRFEDEAGAELEPAGDRLKRLMEGI